MPPVVKPRAACRLTKKMLLAATLVSRSPLNELTDLKDNFSVAPFDEVVKDNSRRQPLNSSMTKQSKPFSPSVDALKLASAIFTTKPLSPKEAEEWMGPSPGPEAPKTSPMKDRVVRSVVQTDNFDESPVANMLYEPMDYFEKSSGISLGIDSFEPLSLGVGLDDMMSLSLVWFLEQKQQRSEVYLAQMLNPSHPSTCLTFLTSKEPRSRANEVDDLAKVFAHIVEEAVLLPTHLLKNWRPPPDHSFRQWEWNTTNCGLWTSEGRQLVTKPTSTGDLQIAKLCAIRPRSDEKAHYHRSMTVAGHTAYALFAAMTLGIERQNAGSGFKMSDLWEKLISGSRVNHKVEQKIRSILSYATVGVYEAESSPRKMHFSLKYLAKPLTDREIASSTSPMTKVEIVPQSPAKRIQDVISPRGRYFLCGPRYANLDPDCPFTYIDATPADRFITEFPEVLLTFMLVPELPDGHTLVIDNVRKAGTWAPDQDEWQAPNQQEQEDFWKSHSKNGVIVIPEEPCVNDSTRQYGSEQILKEINLVLGALTGDMDRSRKLVAGPWGSESNLKKANLELKFMLQWIAASISGMELSFVPDGALEAEDLRAAVDAVKYHSVGAVWQKLVQAVDEAPAYALQHFTKLCKFKRSRG